MIDESDPRHAAYVWACRMVTLAMLRGCGRGDSPMALALEGEARHYRRLMGPTESAAADRLEEALGRFAAALDGEEASQTLRDILG